MDSKTANLMKSFYAAEAALSSARSAWFADYNNADLKTAYLAAEALYMKLDLECFGR